MAETIKSATVGVVDKIAAGMTAVADKVGATTPSSQTSLAPHAPEPPAGHVNPPQPAHLPPGGKLPTAHPDPPPPGAKSVSADGAAVTPVDAGAPVAQPIAGAKVVGGGAAGGAGGDKSKAVAQAEMVKEPVVPVVPAVPVPVPAAPAGAEVDTLAGVPEMKADGKRKVTFRRAGVSVAVKGSWDDWAEEVDCTGEGGVVALLPGTYFYKFIVDSEYVCDEGVPTAVDGSGNMNNVLVVE